MFPTFTVIVFPVSQLFPKRLYLVGPGQESPAMGWEIHGKSMDKSMDESRVFGNPDFGKKSRCENKLVNCCKVFKVCGEKFQCCGINFSMRFQIK